MCFAKNRSVLHNGENPELLEQEAGESLCTLALLPCSSLGLVFGYLAGRTWSWMEHPRPPLSIALVFPPWNQLPPSASLTQGGLAKALSAQRLGKMGDPHEVGQEMG